MNNIIEFNDVSKIYGENSVAVEDINLEVEEGEFLSLVGPSGAGKTTLVRLLIRQEKPTDGTVIVDGWNVNELNDKEIPYLRRKVGVVFQDFKLLESSTAFENIAFALEAAGAPRQQIEEDVPQVLNIVGLEDKADQFPEELSGGEKQRIAMARALVHKPKILIADEPTGNLDPINGKNITDLLVKINQMGTTVLLATHDKEAVDSINERVINLKEGRLVKDEKEGVYVI